MAVVYDDDWYVGCILERSDEHQDIMVNFMHRSGPVKLLWPAKRDECNVPFNHVLCSVPVPMSLASSGRYYMMEQDTVDKILRCFRRYKARNLQTAYKHS